MGKVSRAVCAAVLICVQAFGAQKARFFKLDTARDFREGEGDGVAVTPDGLLVPVGRWRKVVDLEEGLASAIVLIGDQAYFATGFPARIYQVKSDGIKLLAELEAEWVTSLASDGKTLYFGTTAPAGVGAFKNGKVVWFHKVDADGVWDVVAAPHSSAVAAAGKPAQLLRATASECKILCTLPDTHAKSIASLPDGKLLVGTSGNGLVFSVSAADGRYSLIADPPFDEVSDVVVVDGKVYASCIVGEGKGGKGGKKDVELPKVGGKKVFSEVVEITEEGGVLELFGFEKQVALSLARDGEGVLVGTGYEGEVWKISGSGAWLLGKLDPMEVSAVAPGGSYLLTQEPPGLWKRGAPGGGTFKCKPFALENPAAWGTYRIGYSGSPPRIRFRSGLRKQPDETWSSWSAWLEASASKIDAPPGSALQWELSIPAGGRVDWVACSYLPVNLPPKFDDVRILAPGEVYLESCPPSGQYVDLQHPEPSGIFTVMARRGGKGKEATSRKEGKRYWRVGFRTVEWKAKDPNGDPLRFKVELEKRGGKRVLVRDRYHGSILAVDTRAVPDGEYRFVITADDGEANPTSAKKTTAYSPWFYVDNTPPKISVTIKDGKWWVVDVRDQSSPIAAAYWAVDGSRWNPAAPEDGVLDERIERFVIPITDPNAWFVFRAFDEQHNGAAGSVSGATGGE